MTSIVGPVILSDDDCTKEESFVGTFRSDVLNEVKPVQRMKRIQ